jgi:ribosomal protein L11 methyltransferase
MSAIVELKVEVVLSAVPAIEELLAEREEQRLMVLEDKPSGRAWLAGYFEARNEAVDAWRGIAGLLDPEWLATEAEIKELADRNWRESYKEHFKAWQFGRLHWVPVWERPTFALPPGHEVLWLDPGMAFGTGNHETTRLVVERLVGFAERRRPGDRVIDVGCGSGILALSAAKLGYVQVAAFDNDPLAVEVSRDNAILNDMSGRVEFFLGDVVTGLEHRSAELVLANIQADVLSRFSGELVAVVAPGGAIVLSGILAKEVDHVRASFARLTPGWEIDSREMGEWCDLVLVRA